MLEDNRRLLRASALIGALTWCGCHPDAGRELSAGRVAGEAGAGGAPAASVAAGGAPAAGAPAVLVLLPCQVPDAQLLPTVHAGALLHFLAAPEARVELGTTADPEASAPDAWRPERSLQLGPAAPDQLRVFARLDDPGCADAPRFDHLYQVRAAYPGPPGQTDSSAVAADDPRIVGWATGWVEPVAYGADLDQAWQTPEQALGPASVDTTAVVSLGNGGSLTLTFDPPIADGPGSDFLVFENGHSDDFLELAYVEVSSDGANFVRFDSAYLGRSPVAQYGTLESNLFEGLAGKYRVGYGGPFDLALLRYRPRVQAGQVDLEHIRYVRLVDVVGDGTARDSFGSLIYDPYPTVGSAGFDLDAIGVLHAAE